MTRIPITFALAISLSGFCSADLESANGEVNALLSRAAQNQEDFDARGQLASLCSKFPGIFSELILKEPDKTKRWMAVYAVRMSGQTKCDKALIAVFNDAKESQELRIQIMMALVQADNLMKDRLRPFLAGLHLLIKESPKPSDLEIAIDLSGSIGDKSSLPFLVPLLDDNKVHSYTVDDNGQKVPNTLSKSAYAALLQITGRNDIPQDRQAWKEFQEAQKVVPANGP